ncbi:LytR family transcriptional attenuator [Paenibacillus cellulosilyticus]|uniref:LytR family transcriptional attenuator n=1 Tax=Paenibacillus cellulosilyticus TaxID=375489 RepID=A0A2V2YKP6_9BACL|nr:LCP family protein [Paenibacillus cellulosilyticus]PWV93797.1 LytR family transcriptional attenuator [Paenibacillus cellulosilyticus]
MSLIIIAVVSYVIYVAIQIEHTANKIYEEPTRPVYVSKDPEATPTPTKPVSIEDKDAFTVLMLGVDQRANDPGRSDTIVILSVNPKKNSVLMFNIPRDTRTEIIGHGTTDKINHAYAFGGVDMSLQTIEHFLDYRIDYYVKVNMENFKTFIDLIGGVEVNNPFQFDYEGHNFAQGSLELDGELALSYSRMRYDDPRGDFGRNTRQRDILQSVMHHAVNIQNVTKIQSILDEVGNGVKTNITFDEMKTFASQYRSVIDHVDTVEIKGTGKTISGIWYYIVEPEEQERIHNMLKEHQQTN